MSQGPTPIASLTEADGRAQEQRANGFAPSFLAPGGWILPYTTDPRQMAIGVATDWGLSFEGSVWHLKNAKHISSRDAEELKSEHVAISEGGFEAPLHRRIPAELGLDIEPTPLTSGLLSDLVVRACEDDLISGGRAVEILGLG